MVTPLPVLVAVNATQPFPRPFTQGGAVARAGPDVMVKLASVICLYEHITAQQFIGDVIGLAARPQCRWNRQLRAVLTEVSLGGQLVAKGYKLRIMVDGFAPEHPLDVGLRVGDIRELSLIHISEPTRLGMI